MRRGLACALLATLAVAPAAAAHVTLAPPFLRAGGEATLRVEAPNERPEQPMTELALTVPAGVGIAGAESSGPWRAAVAGRTVTWRGGSLAPGDTAVFRVRLSAPARAGAVRLLGAQRYPDGREVSWDVPLEVLPPGAAAPADGGGLGAAGVLVAAVLGVGVVAVSLVVLRRLRRGSALQKR